VKQPTTQNRQGSIVSPLTVFRQAGNGFVFWNSWYWSIV